MPRHLPEPSARREYDFRGGMRGKYYRAMQSGYTITIHKADGTTVTKEVKPKKDKRPAEVAERSRPRDNSLHT